MTKSKSRKALSATSPAHGPAVPFELKDWQIIGLLALLLVIFFRDILLGNAFLWEDFLYHDYPSRNFAAVSMSMGELPLWNPYTFNGMPYLADIQKTIFYLPCTVLALFVSGGVLRPFWLELMIIAHYLLAGAGMFHLARSFELRRVPAMFAAATFMFSGFMVTHAIHQYIVSLVAWYPWVVLLFRKSMSGSWKWVFVCGLVLGHSTLAGFPQLTLYLYFFLLAFFAFEMFTTYKPARLLSKPALTTVVKAGVIIGLSVGVAMLQLLPTIEFADLTTRAQITYQKATEGQSSWGQILTLLYPKFFGTAGAGGYNYHGPGTYWYFWETCMYVGVLPLFLMLMSPAIFRRSKYIVFFWCFGIFALLFALGDNFLLHRFFFEIVPGFDKFRNAARIGVFLTFGAALLSAFSLQYILYEGRTDRETRWFRNILFGGLGVSVAIFAALFSGSLTSAFPFLKEIAVFSSIRSDALLSLLIAVVSAGLLLGLLRGTGFNRWSGPALVGVLFVDMLVFGGDQNNSKTNPLDYFNQFKQLTDYIRLDSHGELVRVNMRSQQGMLMDRNQGLMDRVYLMEGYTPLVLQRYLPPGRDWPQVADMMNAKYRIMPDEQSRSLTLATARTYLPRAYMVYDARVLSDSAAIFSFMTSARFEPSRTVVLEEQPGISIGDTSRPPDWSANFTSYTLNSMALNVSTPKDGYLVFSEVYYPGWNAYIDGAQQKVFRANWNQRVIPMRAGQHTVAMRYEPASFRNGVWWTLGTVAICFAGIAYPAVRTLGSRERRVTA